MIEFLHTYYRIKAQKRNPLRNNPSYMSNDRSFIVQSINSAEEFNLEQAVLSYYLKENNQSHIGFPIQNIDEQFITTIGNKSYVVIQVDVIQQPSRDNNGSTLATFHQQHQTYPYEPRTISSYGIWKQLWIDKLTVYEQNLQASLSEHRNYFERAWLDVFPYVIGITENAIQYMQAIEKEGEHDLSDSSTITFGRYANQLDQPCFFYDELHFDHPMRDVAEMLRHQLLQPDFYRDDILRYLEEYNAVKPISPFSWKLLYGRLLYPAHFFDQIDVHTRKNDGEMIKEDIFNLCKRQTNYESRLNRLFQQIKQNYQSVHIPMVQWL